MITDINHITLAVKDIHRAFDFYKNVLGFKPLVKWDKGAYFVINDFWFCLNVDEKRIANPCYTHYAFSVSKENFNAMRAKILAAKVPLFKENTSPGDSLYFLDPDGHKLEIHVGNVQERINIKKQDSGNWQNVQWFL
ncbi:MAG: fosfomycin resistance glutathione transferase [Proteobacteria bacterium]|nr:fosfomycin resistance glutathione transferase [Pseudomonadota bacterium]